jgi:transposase
MEKFALYVGIDVSKSWLDIAVLTPENDVQKIDRIDNTVIAITDYVQSLPQTAGILFCLENTGRYGKAFLQVTATKRLKTWVEHPLQIKRSQGMTRGKTDEQDAVRIARYALRFQDQLKLWQPDENILTELKELQSKRDLLVKAHRMLKQTAEKSDPDFRTPMAALKKSIDKIDKKIEALINSDEKLTRQYTLLQSVPGIGKVVATNLLIKTKAFTTLTDPRKLACYMGIAPFPYQSGSSINQLQKTYI